MELAIARTVAEFLGACGLSFSIVETFLFYANRGELLERGYWGIWRDPRGIDEVAVKLHVAVGNRERWIALLMFFLTSLVAIFVTPAYERPNPASVVLFALFVFSVTLFVERFVAYEVETITRELIIAGLAAAASAALELISGWVAAVVPLTWFVSVILLVRYLRHYNVLSPEDEADYDKDMILISLIFLMCVIGYQKLDFIAHRPFATEVLLISAIIVISIAVLMFELLMNAGEHGVDVSVRLVRECAEGTVAPERVRDLARASLQRPIDPFNKTIQRVRNAVHGHMMVRDVGGLFVLVVAPFILILLGISPSITGLQ